MPHDYELLYAVESVFIGLRHVCAILEINKLNVPATEKQNAKASSIMQCDVADALISI